jgi:hypothetical protein
LEERREILRETKREREETEREMGTRQRTQKHPEGLSSGQL